MSPRAMMSHAEPDHQTSAGDGIQAEKKLTIASLCPPVIQENVRILPRPSGGIIQNLPEGLEFVLFLPGDSVGSIVEVIDEIIPEELEDPAHILDILQVEIVF